ncbi:hypothetical protein DL769_008168 [Monosporascus sp. CRB-8-3]|nr:hypothetical protein DL769_008168 [Monosporascus sp. CRB-8-3]
MLPDATWQQLGWITTLAEFLMLGPGVLMGRLVYMYGTRIFVAPFAAISVLALGLLSLYTEYWQVLLCQGVLFGVGCSGTTLPSIVCAAQWFSTPEGLAVGLAGSGGSIGGLPFPVVVTRLLHSQGFAAAMRRSAVVVGCGMVVGVLCCEDPFPSKTERHKAERMPSRNGFTNKSRDDAETPTLDHTESDHGAGGGMNTGLAQYTVAIANGGPTIGRVLPSFLSDHWGQSNVMIMISAASALSMVAIWFALAYDASEAGILFFAAFYGFGSGDYTSLLSTCVVPLVDERLEDVGVKFGVACGFISIGALIGIPLPGLFVIARASLVGWLRYPDHSRL